MLREPSATAGRLRDTRRLRLRRRDAEDLVLQSAERAAREDEVIDVSARLLAGFVHDADGALILRRVLPQALPWVTFLPTEAIDELVEELVATLRAAVSIDNLWPQQHACSAMTAVLFRAQKRQRGRREPQTGKSGRVSPQFCYIRRLLKHADVPDATDRK